MSLPCTANSKVTIQVVLNFTLSPRQTALSSELNKRHQVHYSPGNLECFKERQYDHSHSLDADSSSVSQEISHLSRNRDHRSTNGLHSEPDEFISQLHNPFPEYSS